MQCQDVDQKLIDSIHDYVDEYLDSFNRQLSVYEQYACILIAYDNILNECKKVCSQDNINKIVIIRHYGDELEKTLKEMKIDEKVKEIYMKGLN